MAPSLLFQSLFFTVADCNLSLDEDGFAMLQAKRVRIAERDAAQTNTCGRPHFWCTHPGSSYSGGVDCDGDGIPDPYCEDTSGNKGVIQSASGCADSWPSGTCAGAQTMCMRPHGWCSHMGSSYSGAIDCDGDGIPDPYCEDTHGSKGVVGSASGCASDWPHGVCANSQAVCLRPHGWCSHAGASYSGEMDCDDDGIPDPYCEDVYGSSGFIGSASGCAGTWPSGTCGKKMCNRPAGWCSHDGSSYSGDKDCDGDGIPDPFCQDTAGSTGFLNSATGCSDNWPNGPASCQPTHFMVAKGSTMPNGTRRYECAEVGTSQMDASIRAANREFATVCCNDTTGQGSRPNCNWHDVTQPQAAANCQSVGLRLCTAQELGDGAAQSGGCGYNGYFAWSSTTCP